MKKRILSLILVVSLVISSVPNSVFAGGVTYGDVNGDSEINMRDILAMKRYIAGNGNSIDEIAADVTCDGILNDADLILLKKYITGWDVLIGLPYFNITFSSNGGTVFDAVSVRQGDLISEVPSPVKDNAVFLGWFTDSELANQFYAENPIISDLNLYAKYAATEIQEQQADNTFTLTDQLPELSFNIVSSDLNKNEQAVLAGITLENIGNSDYINLIVAGSNGIFTVTADGGFTEGAGYKLTLDDELLTFAEQVPSNRICTFTIAKEEVIEIALNEDLTYIISSELSDIISNGQAVDTLDAALFGNSETEISGSFTYAGAANLQVGKTLCIYENVKPEDRDTITDYSDDSIAYVEVSGITGTTVSFTSANAENVIALPDTLPILESELTSYDANGSFSTNTSSLDFAQYADLGLNAQTTVDSGDYLVITENDNDIVYGKVESVSANGGITTVIFTVTTAEEIQGTTLDYYTENDVDGNVLLEDADVPLLENQIEAQTIQSGFAEDALNYLAYAATQTDSFQDVSGVENFIMTNADGSAVDPRNVDLQQLGAVSNSSNISVTAQISTRTQHFGKGLRIAVRVSGEISISVGENSEVVINLSGTFVEEVKMTFTADGGAVWKLWKHFWPYISDYEMNANIDVYNFTAISIAAKITLKDKSIDVSAEIKNLMGSKDEGAITAGRQNLFEAYSDMLKNKTDYVTLFERNLCDQEGTVDPFHIIAYSFKMDFVVNVNLNLALGCNLEYMSGTRYNFWFAIKAKEAGNSSMDLMDETFNFQFYVMGHLGIRVGLLLEFSVGLFSTKLASIGITAEVGFYVELFGYFFYQYDSVRPHGTTHSENSSEMCGALFVEFGIYLEIALKVQALKDKFVYNPTLYEVQWPLLWAGVRINIYDFGYLQPPEDDIVLIKDLTSIPLPASLRYMKCLDLREGDLSVQEYRPSKFYYNLSNNKFALNESTGKITVTVPENVRYMECDLTITWKTDKLAFSSKSLTRTIHLVWTNLTDTELQEKHDICVKVGNNIVWSTRVNHGELPTLPTQAEILALIGYDKYSVSGTNLKYTAYTGYGEQTALPATANQTYTFGVTEREYTLTVNGVQNANGSTMSLALTAKFGEKFDLSALAGTGTEITGATFTRYLKTDCSSISGKTVDSTIDSAFATQLLNGTYSYTAKYADNSCKVTYLFYTTDGIAIPSVTEIIKKGTIPAFDYTDYLINQHEGYIATSWDKTIDKVSADTTFTAACSTPTGAKYAITFDSNLGSSVDPIESYRGAAVSAPVIPVREGYTFAGWCSDEQLTNAYTFAKMPEYSFMLYAAWTANEYTLTFDANGGACGTSSSTVTYGSPYGTLPTPILTGFAFTGWYTALTGGTKVESVAVISVAANQPLFAHWVEKAVITDVNKSIQTTTYNENVQAFEIKGTSVTGFTVLYKKAGDSDWSNTAVNAGAYAVMITRAEDETYKAYETTLTDIFVINKLTRTISAPTGISVLNRTITIPAVTAFTGYGDGAVQYAVNTSTAVPSGGWTTRRSFVNLIPNKAYYVFARVLVGDNYLTATCTAGQKVTTGYKPVAQGSAADGYVSFAGTVKTSNIDLAGTGNGNILLLFYHADSTTSDSTVLSPASDMEKNSLKSFVAKDFIDPWLINGIGLLNLGTGSNWGWHGEYVDIRPYPAASYRRVAVNQWFDSSNSGTWVSFSITGFKRSISSFGDFNNWGGTYTVDSGSSGTIDYSYNGLVTDQYGTYNALIHEDAPELNVTSSLAAYDNCFSYSMNTLSIDKAAIYQKMAAKGATQIVLTTKLTFNSRSSNTLETVKTVTINRQ